MRKYWLGRMDSFGAAKQDHGRTRRTMSYCCIFLSLVVFVFGILGWPTLSHCEMEVVSVGDLKALPGGR